jgi:hypothetical protein
MIIGLGFRARSGKDLVADYLVKEYGFKKTAFAETLKRACQEIFHLTKEQTHGDKKEIVDPYWGVTPRYILQKVGTECMRNGYADDVWVRSLDAMIQKNPGNYVITDVRFPNEADAVNEWGGLVVRVDRPQAGATGGIAKHASEVSMEQYDKWNYVLTNDGTIEGLYARVDEFIKEWW